MKAITFSPAAGAERRKSRFLSRAVAAQAKGGLQAQHNRHAPKGEVTCSSNALSYQLSRQRGFRAGAAASRAARDIADGRGYLWSVGLARTFNAVNKVTARAVDDGTGSNDLAACCSSVPATRPLPSTLATFSLSSRPMKIAQAWLTAAAAATT
jgi:hypothetical protein